MRWLAISDAMTVGQWVFNAVITVAMAYVLATRQEKSSLRDKLEAAAGDLVDKKLAISTAELRTSLAVIAEQIRQINARLGKGDGAFEQLDGKAQSLELKTQAMIMDLRRDMATRDDLEALRQEFTQFRLELGRDA